MYCPTCNKRYDAGAFCASDGTALQNDPTSGYVGQVLAERYRVERLIGEGGMGQVYEARHLNINKRFAIKLLKPEVVGSAQSVQRFRQEAWAASSIGHENIVEIDDFATLPDGSVYLAMEFLDGVTLAERLHHGPPIALEEAVAVMLAVGRGLGAAHDKGIVHRDMKPENIFLARRHNRQVAKILDFGIAKMSGADEPSNLTRTGTIFGTPLYMSPEQARGKTADARSDVYSVGVILYELTTGSVPFGGESPVEILSQHIAAPPIAPTQLAPERAIPPALEAVILRALGKEPEARFATMAELVTELEAVARQLPPFSATQAGAALRGGARATPATGTPARGTPATGTPATGTPAPVSRARASSEAMAVARPAPRDSLRAMQISRPPSEIGAAAQGARASSVVASAPSSTRESGPSSVVASTRENAPASTRESGPSSTRESGPSSTIEGVPRKRRGALVAGVAVLLGVGVLATWYVVTLRREKSTVANVNTVNMSPPGGLEKTTGVAADKSDKAEKLDKEKSDKADKSDKEKSDKAETVQHEAAPATREVIVDSVPTGAKILRDGKVVGETPEAMQVGERVAVVLQKEGFVDKPITVDANEARKVLVRLERIRTVATVKLPKLAAPPHQQQQFSQPGAPQAPSPPLVASQEARQKAKREVDPSAILAAAPPPRSREPKDALVQRIETQAAASIPGGRRVGPFYSGVAVQQNGHTDWFIELEGNRCYTFIGEGGAGVDGLFLYLWGPAGHRVRDTRERTPHAQMVFCTLFPGLYHVQAKSAVGVGAYKLGIYSR